MCRPRPGGDAQTPSGDRGARKSRTNAATPARHSSAAERRLHLAQGLEVLVEPVDVLLHLDDARAELADRAERATLLGRLLHDVAELSLGARLPERAAQVPDAEDAGQREDAKPAADPSLEHPRPPCASHTRLRFFAM